MGLRYVPLLLLLTLAGCGSGAAETTSPRLFLAGDGELWVVDPAEAHARHIAMRELKPGDPPYRVVARGDRLVLFTDMTVAVDGSLGARRSLAPQGSFFIPAARRDRLWIVELEPGRSFVRAVREITIDGRVTVHDVRPPGGEWPIAAVADGLLLLDDRDRIALWDPVRDAIVRRLDIEPGGLGAASGDIVTSCEGWPCRALRLTDARTGASRTVPAPDETLFEPWQAAFSPDGTTLGIPVHEPGNLAPRRLALIDVDEPGVSVVSGSVVPAGYTFVIWSPPGDQVFITGGERFEPRALVAYRLGDRRAREIDVEVGDFYGAAAL